MSATAIRFSLVRHRRQQLRRLGGNQYRKDRGERVAATVCGAPVTEYDLAYRDRGEDWTRQDGVRFIACRKCWSESGPVREEAERRGVR